jgi:hypothetical protein
MFVGILEYPLETIAFTSGFISRSLSRAALPPMAPGTVKSSITPFLISDSQHPAARLEHPFYQVRTRPQVRPVWRP